MQTVRFDKSRRYQQKPGGTIFWPVLRLRLTYGQTTSPEFTALVDSGADRSTFHISFAHQIGVDLAACQRGTILGAEGQGVTSYRCSLRMDVESTRFNADVLFVDNNNPTMALLGREDVFKEFRIGFDQRSQFVFFGRY